MPIKSKVKMKNTPSKALKALEKANERFSGPDKVKVGLPKSSNPYPDGTSVIMVGAVHEFGSPSRNIPQRSYLRSTVNEKKREYKDLFKKLSKKIVKGDIDMKEALGLIGVQVQGDVQSKIVQIKAPPLKDRDGNPLIDTGHLRQSITFEVET